MTIEQLLAKSRFFNALQKPAVLFEELTKIEQDHLDYLISYWKPVNDFYPVNLLRFLVANLLKKNETVNENTLDDLKIAIEARDISKYYSPPEKYLESFKNYKKSNKGLFPQWKEPFTILYPFFLTKEEKQETKDAIVALGGEIIKRFNLKNATVHAVGFDGPQFYGSDRVWGAVIPKDAGDVQSAYQLFFDFSAEGIRGGLYMGHKLGDTKFKGTENTFDSWEDCLNGFEPLVEEWEKLNSKINFTLQPDEKEFWARLKSISEENLGFYFGLLDAIIEQLSIPNEENLVFSTKAGQLSFQVGKRYCLNLKEDKYFFIAPENFVLDGVEITSFSNPKASYVKNAGSEIVLQSRNSIVDAVQFELDRNSRTDEKEYDNSAFRKAVYDKEYRKKFNIPPYEIKKDNDTPPLNQIFFGPPGTGKTYQTIDHALIIAAPENYSTDNHKENKRVFDELLKKGQVVFTSFHQSMSYEDFIEGIKPLKPEEGDTHLKYEIEDGVFKRICSAATTPNQVDLNTAYNQFIGKLAEKEMIELKTPNGKGFSVSLNSNNNLNLHTGKDKNKQGTLTKENLQKLVRKEELIYWHGYFIGVLNYLRENYNYNPEKRTEKQNYVLIIDEINRGNIAAIFGELITLIEEDKRQGGKEALEVVLPYSKEKFSVPSNLYIIGTMNTADRSVEALDTALRRRFSFVEMPPLYDLEGLTYEYAGVQAGDLLKTINSRIEKLLDKDHQIGHSYLLKSTDESTEEKLVNAFYRHIIPLLQEYFFGDFGKIGLILGEGFVTQKHWDTSASEFAEFNFESGSEYEDKPVYRIVDYRHKAEDHKIKVKDKPEEVKMSFEKAIKLLMRQSIE